MLFGLGSFQFLNHGGSFSGMISAFCIILILAAIGVDSSYFANIVEHLVHCSHQTPRSQMWYLGRTRGSQKLYLAHAAPNWAPCKVWTLRLENWSQREGFWSACMWVFSIIICSSLVVQGFLWYCFQETEKGCLVLLLDWSQICKGYKLEALTNCEV